MQAGVRRYCAHAFKAIATHARSATVDAKHVKVARHRFMGSARDICEECMKEMHAGSTGLTKPTRDPSCREHVEQACVNVMCTKHTIGTSTH